MTRYYFDHNATTPVSAAVLEVLVPALLEVYGNASSIHRDGQLARQRLEIARRQTAALLHCDPKELVFLSGGTEADNLAIFGSVKAHPGARKHVITTAIEHPAVLNPARQLEREGVEVTYVPAGPDGLIHPDDVRRALRAETVLISVMHVNNELGTIQPIEEIAKIAREAGVLLHADGVQAAGKIPVDVKALGVDLYSISGHKLYAPKGIGALYVKNGTKLSPTQFGGRHERERRAGTENVPGAVALGVAAEAAASDLTDESSRIAALRDRLERGILDRVPATGVNGSVAHRGPNTSNIHFDGLEGEAMVISLDLKGFAVSSGAACSSGAVEPSHVLLAIGLSREQARASLRFSLGRSNTEQQVDALIEAIAESAAQLRHLSPTYTARA
ncbi:MAG TPA: cysteine desulfurase family protein [Bryobacteraceae bacterium]|nr:cysteine desulfurase family protein [Bryobacteraceae bacterium]